MTLLLRKVTGHIQAPDAYRVIYDGVEVGSVGKQVGNEMREFWAWGIDTVLPRQPFVTSGQCDIRDRAMENFKISWEMFAANPERLSQFMHEKRHLKEKYS